MRILGTLIATLLLLLSAPLSASAAPTSKPGAESDGPHASASRVAAPVAVRTAEGARVSDVDLGTWDITGSGKFRTPVRGLVVVPAQASGPVPVLVLAHLRSAGCSSDQLEHPCSSGLTEVRLDRGMEWLATRLAARGWAVVVPDLAPVYIQATP